LVDASTLLLLLSPQGQDALGLLDALSAAFLVAPAGCYLSTLTSALVDTWQLSVSFPAGPGLRDQQRRTQQRSLTHSSRTAAPSGRNTATAARVPALDEPLWTTHAVTRANQRLPLQEWSPKSWDKNVSSAAGLRGWDVEKNQGLTAHRDRAVPRSRGSESGLYVSIEPSPEDSAALDACASASTCTGTSASLEGLFAVEGLSRLRLHCHVLQPQAGDSRSGSGSGNALLRLVFTPAVLARVRLVTIRLLELYQLQNLARVTWLAMRSQSARQRGRHHESAAVAATVASVTALVARMLHFTADRVRACNLRLAMTLGRLQGAVGSGAAVGLSGFISSIDEYSVDLACTTFAASLPIEDYSSVNTNRSRSRSSSSCITLSQLLSGLLCASRLVLRRALESSQLLVPDFIDTTTATATPTEATIQWRNSEGAVEGETETCTAAPRTELERHEERVAEALARLAKVSWFHCSYHMYNRYTSLIH
jgi:hypothetical protein